MKFRGERIRRFSEMKEGHMHVLVNEELRNGKTTQKAYAFVYMKKKKYDKSSRFEENMTEEIAYHCDVINTPPDSNSDFIIYETIDQPSLDDETSALYTLMEI